jgi:hypothetical protein
MRAASSAGGIIMNTLVMTFWRPKKSPEPLPHGSRQPVACLPSHHDDLATVVSLVGDEVGEHMGFREAASDHSNG